MRQFGKIRVLLHNTTTPPHKKQTTHSISTKSSSHNSNREPAQMPKKLYLWSLKCDQTR